MRGSHWSGKLQIKAELSSPPPSSCHHRKHKANTGEEQSSGSRPSCSFCPFLEVLYFPISQCQPPFQAILTTVIERHLREFMLGIQVFGDKLTFFIDHRHSLGLVSQVLPQPAQLVPKISSKVDLQDDSLFQDWIQCCNTLIASAILRTLERQIDSSVSFLCCSLFLARCLRFELKK